MAEQWGTRGGRLYLRVDDAWVPAITGAEIPLGDPITSDPFIPDPVPVDTPTPDQTVTDSITALTDGTGATNPSDLLAAQQNLQTTIANIKNDPVYKDLVVQSNGQVTNPDGSLPSPSTLSALDKFLGTSSGKFLGSLALGAAGLGAGMLAAKAGGGGQSLTLPPATAGQPAAVTAAQPALLAALANGGNDALQQLILQNLQSQGLAAQQANQAIGGQAAIESASQPIRSLASGNLTALLNGTAPPASPAYNATTGAVMTQLEKILGLSPGSLTRPLGGGPGSPAGTGGGAGNGITANGVPLSGNYSTDFPALRNAGVDVSEGTYQAMLSNPASFSGTGPLAHLGYTVVDPRAAATGGTNLADSLTQTSQSLAPPVGITQDPNLPAMQAALQQLITGGSAQFNQADPVQAAMQKQVLNALNGGIVDPGLEQQIAQQKEILMNKLAAQYGSRDSAQTGSMDTAGTIPAYVAQQFQNNADIARYNVNQGVVNSVGPQEAQRSQFNITNPQQMYLSSLGFYGPQTAQRSQLTAAQQAQMLGLYLPQIAGNAQFNQQANQNNIQLASGLTGLNAPGLANTQSVLGNQFGTTVAPLTGVTQPNIYPSLANAATTAFGTTNTNAANLGAGVAQTVGRAASAALAPSVNLYSGAAPSGSGASSLATSLGLGGYNPYQNLNMGQSY